MLDSRFDPKATEGRIYAQWEASGAFKAGRRPGAETFCIMIPPPNITGRLHIGHALNNTLQDILVRFERMRGKDVLWQVGTDHAGIATQLIVERQLAEKQQSRVQMGREKFLEAVWKWKDESGGAIIQQLRRLGASADWERERFTMDEGLSRAVLKVFVELYNQGLIYKDKRLVNWDPRLQTAVSDLEVESIEMKGHLWYLKYPIENQPGRFITVATTRPETMLGDTAVAVHPDDARYKDLIGKNVILPLVKRRIPIIADEYSDPEKGTGAVKITPGHDFNDFEVGKRHGLPVINILSKTASIDIEETHQFWENTLFADSYSNVDELIQDIGGYQGEDDDINYTRYVVDDPELDRLRNLGGLDRFEARTRIVSELEAQGLLEKIEPITHAVPHDEKTKTVVLEPLLTEQWYCNVKPLADRAIEAVEQGRTKFVPEQWTNTFYNWMRTIHPWCISRQLWWGHHIPAWYGPEKGLFVASTEAEAIAAAQAHYGKPVEVVDQKNFMLKSFMGSTVGDRHKFVGSVVPIYRDPDVLDTWFSSALWPFSTLGWPDQTNELKHYYPTSVLSTAFDIIFFWVARMMMMGLHFMDDVPFHTVFIHTRVLDEKGAKMSKTKGNVVDPVDLVEEFGADALRFTLASAAGTGRDMRIGASRVEPNRNFGTKLWNATRFCEMNGCVTQPGFDPAKVMAAANQWIIAETAQAASDVTAQIANLKFNEASATVYHFVYDVFCDWYLEICKPVFNGTDDAAKAETRATAAWARDQLLKLLHPFMPFITEELWTRTAEGTAPRSSLLIEAEWPDFTALPKFEDARRDLQWVIDLVSGVRSVRAEMNVPPSAKIALVLKDGTDANKALLIRQKEVILQLARLAAADAADTLPKGSAQFLLGEATVGLPLGDVIDFAKERARLEKELKKANDEITRFDAKLNNEQFVAKAPEDVLTEQREKRAEAIATAARLKEAVARLSS